jgi:hypothetical protein
MLVQILLTNIALTKRIVWADTSEYCSAYTQALAYGEADRKLFANDYADEDDIIQIWATANLFLLHLGNRIPGSESLGLKLTFDGICGEGRGAPDLWKNNLWVDVEPEFPRYWFGFYGRPYCKIIVIWICSGGRLRRACELTCGRNSVSRSTRSSGASYLPPQWRGEASGRPL